MLLRPNPRIISYSEAPWRADRELFLVPKHSLFFKKPSFSPNSHPRLIMIIVFVPRPRAQGPGWGRVAHAQRRRRAGAPKAMGYAFRRRRAGLFAQCVFATTSRARSRKAATFFYIWRNVVNWPLQAQPACDCADGHEVCARECPLYGSPLTLESIAAARRHLVTSLQ